MGQKKSKKAGVARPQYGRPPSPPRGLSDILGSSQLTDEFKSHLSAFDEENEDTTQTTWLEFAVACSQLRGHLLRNDHSLVKAALNEMATAFFNARDRSKRVVLNNPVLRDECQRVIGAAVVNQAEVVTDDQLSSLWRAEEDVSKQLDGQHQAFLLEKRRNSASNGMRIGREVANACLL